MKKFLTALFLTMGVFGTAVCLAQDDQVFLKDTGVPLRGVIKSVGREKVTIQVRGGERGVDVKDILKVTFDGEPTELSNARTRVFDGQLEDALKELSKIDVNTVTNAVIKQDVEYYKAFAAAKHVMASGGDKKAAEEQLSAFAYANVNSFHFFEAAELLGDLAFAQSDYVGAARFYNGLGSAPWDEYKLRGTVLQARANSAGGQYAEALPKFEEVLASGLNNLEALEQKMHATVGKAVCLAATGKHEEGIAIIEDLIAKHDPTDATLFGRAYNALGVCYLKSDKPKEALRAFLHTDVLFYTNAEAHAEALYYLSDLWVTVGRSDRSDRTRSLLRTQYAGTRWAAMQ